MQYKYDFKWKKKNCPHFKNNTLKKSSLAMIKQFFLSNYYIFTLFWTNKWKKELQVKNNPEIEAKKSKAVQK